MYSMMKKINVINYRKEIKKSVVFSKYTRGIYSFKYNDGI